MEDPVCIAAIDIGTQYIKGCVDVNNPFYFTNAVGTPRTQNLLMGAKHWYVGDEAPSKRGILTICKPCERGIITNHEMFEKVFFHTVYNELRIAPEEAAVIVCQNIFNPPSSLEKTTEIYFEQLNGLDFQIIPCDLASKYYLAPQSEVCVIVDLGGASTTITPIISNKPYKSASIKMEVDSNMVTDYLVKLISNRPNSNFIPKTTAEFEIVRDIKEKHSFCNQTKILKSTQVTAPNINYELPDGTIVSLSHEIAQCTEIYFQPALIGFEEPSLSDCIFSSIKKLDTEIQKKIIQNGYIVLTGAASSCKDLNLRLTSELTKLFDSPIKVMSGVAPMFNSCRGSYLRAEETLSNENLKSQFWLTKKIYDEVGPSKSVTKFYNYYM